MSSKVAFRARNLDANRALPVLREHELPPEFIENVMSGAPRITQQEITTGMEKEEETEHHLQQALTAQQIYKTAEQQAIPIPEIFETDEEQLRSVYQRPFKLPKSLINSQAHMFENDKPAYDADEEDLSWLANAEQQLNVATFECMIQRLEEGCSMQRLVTPEEARLLLKTTADESLAMAVYQHWLSKRTSESLIPTVMTEKRDGSNNNNPYVAFRRRKEKMQTRKNRKNDELSYERMLKLRLDLSKASLLLELIKRREEAKRELCALVGGLFERRYAAGDFGGTAVREAELTAAKLRRLPLPPLAVAAFTKFCAVSRSPTAAAALQGFADREAASHKRRPDEPPTVPRRMSRRGLPLDDEDDLYARRTEVPSLKRRRVTTRPTHITTGTVQTSSVASSLPPAEYNLLLRSHLPSWCDEDTQVATNIDREFAFRRKSGCRYAAARHVTKTTSPRSHSYSYVCVPSRLNASKWGLYRARLRLARSRRVVLDLSTQRDSQVPIGTLDITPTENGVPVSRWSDNRNIKLAWCDVINSAERCMCIFCDSTSHECNATRVLCGSLDSSTRPHIGDVDVLKCLRDTHQSVYFPRCLADNDDECPKVTSTHSDPRPVYSARIFEIVRLYLDGASANQQVDPSTAHDDLDDQASSTSSQSIMNGGNATVAHGSSSSHAPNGFSVTVCHERPGCAAPSPLLNGNNNNDAARLGQPTRLETVGKRRTEGLSNFRAGVARSLENGSSKAVPPGFVRDQQSQSALNNQPSAIGSDADGDTLISDQVRTRTPTIST